mmetsp:Transcript_38525/g.95542  ORF Transcript_38525/g.95542 Transcript_38525/m.95542 type:complete len:257 (-) Transcript_38525:637-1407(-)
MCMQPMFFSMGRLHSGHGLVLARIQFMFSLSALFLMSHLRTVSQSTGRCASSWQLQQKEVPQVHCTSTGPSPAVPLPISTTFSHPAPVHHFTLGLSSTHDRHWNVDSFAAPSGPRYRRAMSSVTRDVHLSCGHRRFRHEGPSASALSRYPFQHVPQKLCLHPTWLMPDAGNSSKHTPQVTWCSDSETSMAQSTGNSPTLARTPSSFWNHSSCTRFTFHLKARSSCVASSELICSTATTRATASACLVITSWEPKQW